MTRLGLGMEASSLSVAGRRRRHVDARPLQTAARGDRPRAHRAEGDRGGHGEEGDGGEGGDQDEDRPRG